MAIDAPDISPAGMSRTNVDATVDGVLDVGENGNSLLRWLNSEFDVEVEGWLIPEFAWLNSRKNMYTWIS